MPGIGKIFGYALKGAKKFLGVGAKQAEKTATKVVEKAEQKTGKIGSKFNYSVFDSKGKQVMSSMSHEYNSGGYVPNKMTREVTAHIPHGDETRMITTKSTMGYEGGGYRATTTVNYSVRDAEGFIHPEGKSVVTRTGLHDEDCAIKYFDRFGKEVKESPVKSWMLDLQKAVNQ